MPPRWSEDYGSPRARDPYDAPRDPRRRDPDPYAPPGRDAFAPPRAEGENGRDRRPRNPAPARPEPPMPDPRRSYPGNYDDDWGDEDEWL
ncbi:MAG: hypothetical protein IGR92_17835 [Leptolyngbyaceae cyanobacterium T60_A2020_046]|nr:hypothetical protein [Leptolyngbyaceae cyanobacterium T60_A2020_046]